MLLANGQGPLGAPVDGNERDCLVTRRVWGSDIWWKSTVGRPGALSNEYWSRRYVYVLRGLQLRGSPEMLLPVGPTEFSVMVGNSGHWTHDC